MSPKISIILPCYNVEKYIDKCIKSIQQQTFTQYEVICIDDCSTDKTSLILQKYHQKNIIKLITLEKNQGAANARRVGLKYCRGLYIAYIDPDDYIKNNYLEVLYNATENETIDLVLMNGSTRVTKFTKKKSKFTLQNINKKETDISKYLCNFFGYHIFPAPVWGRIYKKSILENTSPINIFYQDDVLLNFYVFTQTLRDFKVIDYQGYFYRDGGGTSSNPNYLRDNIECFLIRLNWLEQNSPTDYLMLKKCLIIEFKSIIYESIIRKILEKETKPSIMKYIQEVINMSVLTNLKNYCHNDTDINILFSNNLENIYNVAKSKITFKRKVARILLRII